MSRRPSRPDLQDALVELKRERRTRDHVYCAVGVRQQALFVRT
jgi:hypothetical protein